MVVKRKMITKLADLEAEGVKVVVLNKEDAADMDLDPLDRVVLERKTGKSVTALVNLTERFVDEGEIGLYKGVYEMLEASDKEEIYVRPSDKPDSIQYIKEKLRGERLNSKKIHAIVEDLMQEELSNVELTAWITANFIRGMEKEEVVSLTEAIVGSGSTLNVASKRVFDKHCIGGVAGNKTTMIIVPIIAASGLTIPKTSSRAITSPAGTADCVEVLAPVDLCQEEIERIVNRVHGCMVWGGAMNIATADDKLIKIRHPLSLDPQGMLLASILAKKKAVSATDLIIDIPIGKGSKVGEKPEAEELARQFDDLGNKLGMNVHPIITDGDHPVGMAVGPSIEAKEVLRILGGEDVSNELREKACKLAGILLEISEKAKKGEGYEMASKLIEDGSADRKFREILEAQGGNPKVSPDDVVLGEYTHIVKAESKGKIEHIDNRGISAVARGLGAPQTHEAGLYLHVEEGSKIQPGDDLFTLYATSERKIDQAIEVYKARKPIGFSRIILEEFD